MEQLSYGNRLRELRLFSMKRRGLQVEVRAAFQYLKGKGACYKSLWIRYKEYTMRVVRQWLPSEVVGVLSSVVFKARLDGALSNLV